MSDVLGAEQLRVDPLREGGTQRLAAVLGEQFMQSLDIAFRLGDEMIGVETRGDDSVAVRLASGKVFIAQTALVCVGRVGETESLNLEAAGVGVDERGRVWCDAKGGTWASHITAVGNIVGFRAASSLAG